MEVVNENKPSKLKYVGAWFVMGLLNLLLSFVLSFIVLSSSSNYFLSEGFWNFIVAPLLSAMPIVAFYITYRIFFKSLNGWRVLPWLYVLGTLGFMSSTGSSFDDVAVLIGQESARSYLSVSLFFWVVSLLVIRNGIVAKSGFSK